MEANEPNKFIHLKQRKIKSKLFIPDVIVQKPQDLNQVVFISRKTSTPSPCRKGVRVHTMSCPLDNCPKLTMGQPNNR